MNLKPSERIAAQIRKKYELEKLKAEELAAMYPKPADKGPQRVVITSPQNPKEKEIEEE